jgi:hypothetical protein
MHTDFIELLNDWKNFLSEIETKMQLSIKVILDELKDNNKIHSIFFEYHWDLMNIGFIAKDINKNILVNKYDLLLDEIYAKTNVKPLEQTLFPLDLLRRQVELDDPEIYVLYNEYDREKCNIFEEWFKSCWDKVAREKKHISKAFLHKEHSDHLWDLNKNKKVKIKERDIKKILWK